MLIVHIGIYKNELKYYPSEVAVPPSAFLSGRRMTPCGLRPPPPIPPRFSLEDSCLFFICVSCSECHFWNLSIAVASSNKPSFTPRKRCFKYRTPLNDSMRRTVSVGCAPLCNQSNAL